MELNLTLTLIHRHTHVHKYIHTLLPHTLHYAPHTVETVCLKTLLQTSKHVHTSQI